MHLGYQRAIKLFPSKYDERSKYDVRCMMCDYIPHRIKSLCTGKCTTAWKAWLSLPWDYYQDSTGYSINFTGVQSNSLSSETQNSHKTSYFTEIMTPVGLIPRNGPPLGHDNADLRSSSDGPNVNYYMFSSYFQYIFSYSELI